MEIIFKDDNIEEFDGYEGFIQQEADTVLNEYGDIEVEHTR